MVRKKDKKLLIIAAIIVILSLLLLALFWDDIFGGVKDAMDKSDLVVITCGEGLYEDSNCNGACSQSKGQECASYDESCYICICPDLIVSSLSANVTKRTVTRCSSESELSCSTSCSLRADAQIEVKNSGRKEAGESTTLVDFAPEIDQDSVLVPALASEEKSDIFETNFSIEQTVSGRKDSCFDLGWWNSTYTVTAISDYGRSVTECDEENNEKTGQPRVNQ